MLCKFYKPLSLMEAAQKAGNSIWKNPETQTSESIKMLQVGL